MRLQIVPVACMTLTAYRDARLQLQSSRWARPKLIGDVGRQGDDAPQKRLMHAAMRTHVCPSSLDSMGGVHLAPHMWSLTWAYKPGTGAYRKKRK